MFIKSIHFIHHTALARFLQPLQDQIVTEKNDATFTCQVYPADSVLEWIVDSHAVTNSDKYRLTNDGPHHSLTIISSREEDEGVVCASLGDCETHANLIVEGTYLAAAIY